MCVAGGNADCFWTPNATVQTDGPYKKSVDQLLPVFVNGRFRPATYTIIVGGLNESEAKRVFNGRVSSMCATRVWPMLYRVAGRAHPTVERQGKHECGGAQVNRYSIRGRR